MRKECDFSDAEPNPYAMKPASFISEQVLSGEYYYLNLHPAKDTTGTVVCGGLEQCDPHYHIARARFRFQAPHENLWVNSGGVGRSPSA